MKKLSLLTIATLLSCGASQAALTATNFSNAGVGNDWSNSANWSNGLPGDNTYRARLYNAAPPNVDQSYTIGSFMLEKSSGTATLGGPGTLTIDNFNDAGDIYGLRNRSAGATLSLNGAVTIAHTTSTAVTVIDNQVNAGNVILFDTGSTLTINTQLQVNQGIGGAVRMNGTILGGSNLRIGSDNVTFGNGHDSTGFNSSIVLFNNSKLDVRGGSVLSTGKKFQVNGTNAELVLQFAANSVNGANVSLAPNASLLLDVNSRQENMGVVILEPGATLTVNITDLTPATVLGFADSSGQTWGTGATITIAGFQENVIRFGTDSGGLSAGQLAAIDGGAYTLSSTGFLTAVPEPSTFALLAGGLALGFIAIRRRRC